MIVITFKNMEVIMFARLLARLVIFMFLASGCSLFPQQESYNTKPVDVEKITIDQSGHVKKEADALNARGWWQVNFHRHYEYEDEVSWEYGSLIALKILKPIIESNSLELWRFHRRAVDDQAGHRFAFIFYATRKKGEEIYQNVTDHTTTKQLIDNGHIDRLTFYNINKELKTGLEDTSDKNWPIELQKSWPHFIMGVSQTWLALVQEYYSETGISEEAGLEEQLDAFRQVNANVNLVWKHSGSHAFLHHLNALFGFQELYIIERRLGRF